MTGMVQIVIHNKRNIRTTIMKNENESRHGTRSLISAFVVRCLDSTAIAEISRP